MRSTTSSDPREALHGEPDALIGRQIAGYEIVSLLGMGGMAVVYEAVPAAASRESDGAVAIKILRPELGATYESTNRFIREARALAALRHPRIVRALDAGMTTDHRPYLVMEKLSGETLQSRLDREGAFSEAESVRIALQIAEALAAAHEAGVIHRDLKPSNVFLLSGSPDTSEAKVLDFGLAKIVDRSDSSPATFLTRTGVRLGTPLYMSPEQCNRGSQVDARTDVYALGCVLYAMLAGAPPFPYASEGVLIAAHLYERPRALGGATGVAVAPLLFSMLAKSPEDRPPRMVDVCSALAKAFVGASTTRPPRVERSAPNCAGAITESDIRV